MTIDTVHIRLLPLDPADKTEVEARGCKPYLDLAMPPTRTFKQIQLYLFRKWIWLKELLQSPTSGRSLNLFYIDALEQRSSCLLRTYLNQTVYTILQSALNVSNTVTLVYSFQLENKLSPSSFPERLPISISPLIDKVPRRDDVSIHSITMQDQHQQPHSQADQDANMSLVEDSLMIALNSPLDLGLTIISPQFDSRKRKHGDGGEADHKNTSPSPYRLRQSPRSSSKKRESSGVEEEQHDLTNVMSKEDSLFILLDDFLDTRYDASHLDVSTSSLDHAVPMEPAILPALKTKLKSKKRKEKRKRISTASVNTMESEPKNSPPPPQRRNPRNLRRIRPTFLAPLSAHDDFMATFKKLSSFSKLR